MDLIPLSLSDPRELTAPARPLAPSDYPLNLLLSWAGPSSRQFLLIGAGSALVHVVLFILMVQLPGIAARRLPKPAVVKHTTPLYFPKELTQKSPNKGKPTKEIDLASLIASQKDQQEQQSSPNASVRRFSPPTRVGASQVEKNAPRIEADAPNLASNQNPADAGAGIVNGLAPAPPPPDSKPSPQAQLGSDSSRKATPARVPPPPGSLKPGSSEENQSTPAPALPGLNGQIGSFHPAIELLSDPQGADFKPYLEQILTIVRNNWHRVTPEAVRQGRMRGRSVVQFVIGRDGSIMRVVIAEPSGITQLDLAASSSLMMSNPLPQLPAEFKGEQVKLAFTFSYNMPIQ